MKISINQLRWVVVALVLVVSLCVPVNALADGNDQPNYGSATVDGDISEWDLEVDYFAPMYRAAKSTFMIESYLYLRYDTPNETLYILVLSIDEVDILVNPGDSAYVKINNVKGVDGTYGVDGSAPDFAWYGLNAAGDRALGWEASVVLPLQTPISINVHTNVFDNGEPQTSAVANRDLFLEVLPYDYGDMIPAYQITTLAEGGPRHYAGPMRLGLTVDGELDGQNALGEIEPMMDDLAGDDEDGVEAVGNWLLTGVPMIQVTVGGCPGTCYLNGWIDWGNDLSFLEDGDQIFLDEPVTDSGLNGGVYELILDIPEGVSLSANFYARFRICQAPGLCNVVVNPLPGETAGQMTILADDEVLGEIEDYYWPFAPTAVTIQSFQVTNAATSGLLYLGGGMLALMLGVVIIGKRKRMLASPE